jgi:hypothetical protein
VWGDPSRKCEISIAGQHFKVTESVYAFLETFHPHNKTRDQELKTLDNYYYWIDAISVDQSNLAERSEQVLLMTDIFQNAYCTLAWLGPAYEDSHLALDFVKQIKTMWSITKNHDFVDGLLTEPEHRDSWVALHRLFLRPWWNRVWIRQEFVLSRHMLVACGDRWCSGSHLFDAIMILSGSLNFYSGVPAVRNNVESMNLSPVDPNRKERLMMGNPGFEEAKDACRVKAWVCYQNLSLPLLCIMGKTLGAKCADPRDRIYGALGLAADSRILVPQVDYSASLLIVYANLVEAHVSTYERLDIICLGRVNRTQGLPTWVPDWSGQAYGTLYMASMWATCELDHELHRIGSRSQEAIAVCYNASRDISPKVRFSPDHTWLQSEGLFIATIDGLGQASDLSSHEAPLVQSRGSINREVNPAIYHPSDLKQAFTRALLCDRFDNKPLDPAFGNPAFLELTHRARHGIKDPASYFHGWFQKNKSFLVHGRSFEDWVQEWTAGMPDPIPEDEVSANAHLYTLDAAATQSYYRKRLMSTLEGPFGMGPHEARPGDQIWVLFGCSVPVTLRPCQDGDSYEFIGECYVDGFMAGKAINEYEAGTRQAKTVILK